MKKNVLFVIIVMIAMLWQREIPIMNKRNHFLATRRLLVSLWGEYSSSDNEAVERLSFVLFFENRLVYSTASKLGSA